MYAWGVNFMFPFFMNVYHIYILIVWFIFAPLLMIWQKGGEVFDLYMHVYWQKEGEIFEDLYIHVYCFINKKEENIFWEKNSWFMHVSLTLFMHIYLFSFMHFIAISFCLLLCMSWGGTSMKLDFNPCI